MKEEKKTKKEKKQKKRKKEIKRRKRTNTVLPALLPAVAVDCR